MRSSNLQQISIITVVKDDFENFRATAGSLLSQKCRNFQWVIIDGSVDFKVRSFLNSVESEFSYVYQRLAPNGIYNAMNFSSDCTDSEWIWFLNAGDFLIDENVIENIHTYLQESDRDLVASEVVHVSKTGFAMAYSMPKIFEVNGYKVAQFNHQGVFMKRRLFIEIGGFDESLKYAADGKLLDTAVRIARTEMIDDCFVAFKLGGASSINYAHSVAESRLYRPSLDNLLQRKYKLSRNKIRIFILNHEEGRFLAGLIRWYLRNKENKLKMNLSESQLTNLRFH
jgi:hypothetical protein